MQGLDQLRAQLQRPVFALRTMQALRGSATDSTTLEVLSMSGGPRA